MTNLFFISSSGSMATKWMSKVLSASPKIKCFHGSFGLQKLYNANLDMASALYLLGQWATQNNTQFVGVTHLSMNHGTVGVRTCESMGVPFCGLARDPILATDSQYQERVQSESLPRIKLVRYWEMAKSIEGMEQLLDEAEQSDVVFLDVQNQ